MASKEEWRLTQFALWARLIAVDRVAAGWISEAKSFTPIAQAIE